MRRLFNDALISVGALVVLLCALVLIDDRVRQHVVRIAGAAASGDVGGTQLQDIGPIILVAARDQSVAHAPLAIFVIAAAVLLLCMVRT